MFACSIFIDMPMDICMYIHYVYIYIYMCVCAWLNQSCGLVATTPSASVCVAGRRQHLPENVGQLT